MTANEFMNGWTKPTMSEAINQVLSDIREALPDAQVEYLENRYIEDTVVGVFKVEQGGRGYMREIRNGEKIHLEHDEGYRKGFATYVARSAIESFDSAA